MRYEVRFIGDHMVLSTTVIADDADGAVIEARMLVQDYYGLNLGDLNKFKWNAIDIVDL